MSKTPYSSAERETARAILRYLVKHPEAKDTLEGIAQWWLGGGISRRVNVERAVSLLLSRGLVLETRRKGLSPFYQLVPKGRAAALSEEKDYRRTTSSFPKDARRH